MQATLAEQAMQRRHKGQAIVAVQTMQAASGLQAMQPVQTTPGLQVLLAMLVRQAAQTVVLRMWTVQAIYAKRALLMMQVRLSHCMVTMKSSQGMQQYTRACKQTQCKCATQKMISSANLSKHFPSSEQGCL